jgi:drug/metabolite transporter (DMT)-like permease
MLGASALVAATSVLAKTLGLPAQGQTGLHPFQISAGRFVFGFLALSVVLSLFPRSRPSFRGAHWRWHLVRSVCGWLGVSAMFGAVARMPMADATAISFLSPIVTMALAALVLGENLGLKKLLATGLALGGAALILKPGTDAFQAAGLLALAAAVFMGLEALYIKRLSDTEPALRVLIVNNGIGAIIALAAASVVWIWPSGLQWLFLAALGTIMVCAQSLFIQAMKRGEASLVIPVFYSVLVFATLYDLVLFGGAPHWTATAGAALIVSGAVILARRQEGPDKMAQSR